MKNDCTGTKYASDILLVKEVKNGYSGLFLWLADCQSGKIVILALTPAYTPVEAESFKDETHQYFFICEGGRELKWKKLIVRMITAEDPLLWASGNGMILF